jgi:hypothetical protein
MRRSRVRGVGILAVCLTVAATAAVIPSIVQAVPRRFEVTLESSQEVSSSPVITQAIGMATLVLNDAQTALTIDLVHSVMNTTAVIIHRAAAETNGPVALHMGNPGFTSPPSGI